MRLNLKNQGFWVRCIILIGFEVVLFAIVALFLGYFGPAGSVAAAGMAAGVCLLSALLSLWIHHWFRDPQSVLTAVLLGMAINMGIPFAFGVTIHLHGGPLSKAGFLYYLLLFYLLTLVLKTLLTLPAQQKIPARNHLS